MTILHEIQIPRFTTIMSDTFSVRRRSSRPFHLTAPNGLNFSKSVGVPTSRLERVREYLRVNGSSTKGQILRDVFGKTLDNTRTLNYMERQSKAVVTSGWGSTFFSLCVKCGYLTHSRINGKVVWSLPEGNPKDM